MRYFLALSIVVLVLAGCERPRPLSLPQAAAIAAMHLDKAGADWGPTWQVVALEGEDAAGRSWIQVSYAPDPATGEARTVLVNRISRWARFPSPGYRVVLDDHGGKPPVYPSVAGATMGSHHLELRDSTGDDAALVERAVLLNGQALGTGRAPLFSVRGGILVYGIIGERRIRKDEGLRLWIGDVSGSNDLIWVESGEGMSPAAPAPGSP